MKTNKKTTKQKTKNIAIISILLLILTLPLTSILANESQEENLEEQQEQRVLEPEAVDIDTILLSQDVQIKIKEQKDEAYIDTYKNFLVEQNIQLAHKELIEQHLRQDFLIEDILIAYTYLADNYAKSTYLTELLTWKQAGKTWADIFKQYKETVGIFQPRNFDQEYLEELLKLETITPDDVMITDRIASSLNVPFENIIVKRLNGDSFKQICVDEGVLGSAGSIKRVQITMEDIEKYKEAGYEENHIVEAYVLAGKVEDKPKNILEKMDNGQTEEAIIAQYLTEKYQ